MHSTRLRQFARENWLILSVFLAALVITGWFAFQFIAKFVFFNDPRNVDGELRGWMNPHFIVMMYDLPRPLVMDILQRDPDEHGGPHLKEIADDLGLTMPELTQLIRDEAALYREALQ